MNGSGVMMMMIFFVFWKECLCKLNNRFELIKCKLGKMSYFMFLGFIYMYYCFILIC